MQRKKKGNVCGVVQGQEQLFLAHDLLLDLVHQVLLVRLLVVLVVHHGAAVLRLLGRLGVARLVLEDVAGATPAAVLCTPALAALDTVNIVSFDPLWKRSCS